MAFHLVLPGAQMALLGTVFVDVGDTTEVGETEVKPPPQVLRTQHVVQVGNSGKLLCHQPTVEFIESVDAFVLRLDVCSHEEQVRLDVLEQWTGKRTAQHREPDMWVLTRCRHDNWHRHCNVAYC